MEKEKNIKYKILFVCHGNICRSPMAEFVFKDLVKKQGLENRFEIASAATSTEEIGSGVHWGTKNKLKAVGISTKGKYAVQITKEDYEYYDLIVLMDENNKRNIKRIVGEDSLGKIHKMMEYAGSNSDVADPWYTGNFDVTYDNILQSSKALLKFLTKENN